MSNNRTSNRARLLGGAAAAVIALSAAAHAQAQEKPISIAPQSLSTALYELGVQTGQQIIFSPSLASAKASRGASEAADTEAALRQILAGTDLTFRRTNDAWLIVQAGEGGSGPQAASAVEALIVTAQKREEDIQDVPIAISAFSQEDLTRSQVAGGPDLVTQVPNMTFTKTNFTSYSIQIRGIGTQAISATTDPAVAVAFNNTPFITNRFFEQEFYDLERVEVLRGPQGTLYGRNATAGVVNIISAKPKFYYEAKASGDIANYSSHRLEGMVNIPLVEDKAALRLAGAWTKRDGFVKNILTGEQTDGRNLWSGRISLAVAPTNWFHADLIYERFEEADDRLRSGKQLCKKDPGPSTVGSASVDLVDAYPLRVNKAYLSQGCLPSSLYSPESFQTPNGFALPYYGPAGALGSPVYTELDPYASQTQSRDLREIETHIVPEYEAQADMTELQLRLDLPGDLTLVSETAFARDSIFSYQDFNRFDTTPGVFKPGGVTPSNPRFDVVDENGVFCDPQVGCTDRLAAADLATAVSQQFSQEFRLSSDFEGPFNFSLGANFLRYNTEVKYYVFINSLTAFKAGRSNPWLPGISDNAGACFGGPADPSESGFTVFQGRSVSDPNSVYTLAGCVYIDPNDIHNMNDQGRNYFLSKNPYQLFSYAAFGEAYYELSGNLKLTAGFRWTVDKKTAPQHPSWLLAAETYGTAARKLIEQEWREPTGRLAIDWKPSLSFTDESLVYGSYVRGYKAGGANPPPPVVVLYGFSEFAEEAILADSQTHPEEFEAEFIDAYEIGTKNTLLDGRLTLNFGTFYYDYTGYQISQIVNRSAVNLNFDAEVWGLEIEADWRPAENLRLGLKLGYEDTRLADGSEAIDLMDRTAGREGWVLARAFPPLPSNCVLPTWFVEFTLGSSNASLPCASYLVGVDPLTQLEYVENPTQWRAANGQIMTITPSTVSGGLPLFGYPGFDPASAPNNGEGFAKDLSGNELPNAPHYTTTLTADYTVPLAGEWLMTLHTDLYYQSEAWTRIFNTEGYDKLKAYTNVNFAAIFTNEDAGWNVMAYVKNVFDRDSITGAFLNSDDTGLTTNVFLTEPRLYGIRVTKNWNGGAPWGDWFGGDPNAHDPFRVEFGGYYGIFGQEHTLFAPPITELYGPELPFPFDAQEDLDWGSAGGGKITYQPEAGGWSFSAAVRYGRAGGNDWQLRQAAFSGGYALAIVPDSYYDPAGAGLFNYAETRTANEESHTILDFMIGHDVGLGAFGPGGASTLSAGLRYARLKSVQDVEIHGRPDFQLPETDIAKYGGTMHRLSADMNFGRQFEGAGVAVAWDGEVGLGEAGGWGVDLGLAASVLWGKQKVHRKGEIEGDHKGGVLSLPAFGGPGVYDITPRYLTTVDDTRTASVTVPSLEARLGLAYELGSMKLRGGYRWERFFNAIDGGFEERKTYDRDFHGPYFRVSVGFGG